METIIADKIFTGEEWLTGKAIIVEQDLIAEIIDEAAVPVDAFVIRYDGCFIAPAFIDLQIYGAHGSLLAVEPSPATLYKMYEYCLAGGATHFQPTVATNSYEVIYACIDAVKAYWQTGGKGVLGLHIEGPWINAKRKGAHVKSFIHSPTIQQVKELLEYGKEAISMITLAPEVCAGEIVELIQSSGVIVSAGHSDATFEQATGFFNQNISLATHLYNAMSPLHHRAPGMVGAILNHPKVSASIVADGYHVDFAAISIAKNILKDRLFYITDAVTETKTGYYQHRFVAEKYEADGILSGSALTMAKAVRNGVDFAGIELEESLKMASLYPARVMGLDHELGFIKKGYKTALVVLDDAFHVVQKLT